MLEYCSKLKVSTTLRIPRATQCESGLRWLLRTEKSTTGLRTFWEHSSMPRVTICTKRRYDRWLKVSFNECQLLFDNILVEILQICENYFLIISFLNNVFSPVYYIFILCPFMSVFCWVVTAMESLCFADLAMAACVLYFVDVVKTTRKVICLLLMLSRQQGKSNRWLQCPGITGTRTRILPARGTDGSS